MANFIPIISIIFLTILCKVALASRQQWPPTSIAASAQVATTTQEYLETHNKARAEVNVGPLKWSDALAKAASLQVRYQRDHKNCSFANLESSQYGGNQLFAGGSKITPTMAVESWVAEKKFYNYADNSCVQEHQCGVYTQVVWKKSLELGCAQGVCTKDQTSLTICYYNPPGNVIGEKPY